MKKSNVSKILTATLLCMTLPLFLEYAAIVTLIALHAIGGDAFWAFNIAIGFTGLVAAILGALVSVWFLLKRNNIKDSKTKSLGDWVVGLSSAYAVIVLVLMAIVVFRLN